MTDEIGVFDGISGFYSHLGNAGQAQARLTAALTTLNEAFTARTKQLHSAGAADEVTIELLQQSADLSALDMDAFSGVVETELPIMDAEFRSAIQSFVLILPHLPSMGEGGEQQIRQLREFLPGFLTQIESTTDSTRGFRQMIADGPPFTSAHARARRRALNALDNLVTLQEQQAALVRQFLDSLPDEA